jgi:hypothetical protein
VPGCFWWTEFMPAWISQSGQRTHRRISHRQMRVGLLKLHPAREIRRCRAELAATASLEPGR